MSKDRDEALARRGRVIALVIAFAGLAAIFAQPVVVRLGLDPSYEILIYLFSMAAFVWAVVATVGIWRARGD